MEYKTKFTINANANLEISLAYHIFLRMNTFIKNIAIHAQYHIHNITSDELNTHQKKNKRR